MSGGNGLTNNEGNVVSVGLGLLWPFIYGSKSPKLTSSNEAAVSKSSLSNRELRFVSLPHGVEKSNELNAELIVIVKKRRQKLFASTHSVNATLFVKETNAAVMIVNPHAIPNKIKSIVLPVNTSVPERNLELLAALTGKNKPVVHLVTMSDKNENADKRNNFIHTYRTLSDFLHYPVEYKVLSSNLFSKVLLGYEKNIMADLIFVNPFEEKKIGSINRTDISDRISPDSKLCVLVA